MSLGLVFVGIAIGYLIGGISFPRVVVRLLAPGTDLTRIEMTDQWTGEKYYLRNVGATTASMVLGPKIGGLIGILDIFKAFIPVLAMRLIFNDQPYFLFTGAAVVAGHIWPIYYRFRGGGGLSPVLGTLLAVDPLGILLTNVLAMVFGFFVFREFLVVMMAGSWLMIPWLWLRTGSPIYGGFALLLNFLLVFAVIPDVMRYVRARREGTVSMENAMADIPMGRMMNKMMDRMGLKNRRRAINSLHDEKNEPKT